MNYTSKLKKKRQGKEASLLNKKKAVCGEYKLCNPQNTSASHLGKKGTY
jgi:hypothetical protein